MVYSLNMGYEFDKQELNNQRKMLEMTVEDFAFNLEVSPSYVLKLLYSKKVATTISENLLRGLDGMGISDKSIGVNRKGLNRKRGRPRKNV